MGRQNGEASVASSSIALLQERFRELQRIREKRQEKELLKRFSSSESETSTSISPSMHFDHSSKLTFQPDHMILPNNRAPALQDSLLSLTLNSQSNHNHPNFRATPTSLWPNNTATGSSSRSFENSDVDTSLHL
ncbi:hypothetical protein JCGZ_18478 [Jatropha curcas]|uniref:Uncharacterized protein n=1 Tax=Jatropha curcas TaxID=180498 RepID=A0A067KDI0_JATCU|nr:hypothetical protein JCGZ_18478 [Jatropha curcas]